MPVSIYAKGQAQLRLAVLGVKRATPAMRKRINDALRSTFNPIWKQAVAENMGGFTKADTMMSLGTRIKAGNPPALIAASSTRRFGRALVPAQNWPLVEFGTAASRVSSYKRRSTTGATHTVRRHAMTGWPKRIKNGRIATPAADEIIPRLTSYWIQSALKTIADAFEEGAR
ncbi:MAG: hypothetical protein PT944_06465 [Actinomycetaceae bacterium]|nr:hypothetical protein [Actinomycetaceae bacterium]MDY5273012.1 hypothetical protein [Arcanobacterium sp.]